jgi:hypothetical protein
MDDFSAWAKAISRRKEMSLCGTDPSRFAGGCSYCAVLKKSAVMWFDKLCRLVVVGVLLLIRSGVALAAAPRFESPRMVGDQLQLRLSGESGGVYRLESSSNLVTWTAFSSGSLLNGTWEVLVGPLPSQFPQFFRALEVSGPTNAPGYPTVVPTTDIERMAEGLILPETGGGLHLMGEDGTTYDLVIPTNAVFAATTFRMTLLTNVSGIPAQRGFKAGVRLEPEGLVLASPTFLRITYPTNLPSPHVASYAFDNNGSHFHLVPDLLLTNGTRIVVQQFRSFGFGEFTLSELKSLAGDPPALRRPVLAGGKRRLHASLEECYPEQVEEAEEMRKELTESMRPLQEEIGVEIAIERQKQILLPEDEQTGGSWAQGALKRASEWYAENITPRIADAGTKCLVGGELLIWILSWERQMQLLGASDGGSMSELASLLTVCEEQIRKCCEERGPDRRLVVQLIGIERQRQLLGGGSPDGSWDMSGIEACLPQWYGELRFTESYRTNFFQELSDLVSSSQVDKTYLVAAYLDNVDEDIVEPFPLFGIPGSTNLTFRLSGFEQGSISRQSVQRTVGGLCPASNPGTDPGASRRSLASPRLLDGIPGFREEVVENGSLSNLVNVEITVILTDGTGGILGPKTSLQVSVPPRSLDSKGVKSLTEGEYDEFGDCIRTSSTTKYVGTETFGGIFVDAKEHEFKHTPTDIRYYEKISTNGLIRELEIHLQRRN